MQRLCCLTCRSSGRQQGPCLRHFIGPCRCPPLAALLPAPLTLGVRRIQYHMRTLTNTWHSTLLATLSAVAGAALIILFSLNSRTVDFDLFVVYASSIPAMFWLVLAYMLYTRSKYLLPATLITISANYLLTPLSVYLVKWKYNLDLTDFNYEFEVRHRFRALSVPDAIFQSVLFLYALWHTKFVVQPRVSN